ncbi:hypothetical protein DUI87_10851 [Hirundo rustica rustica]|uniref:Uncharacterized protein n=1 Tax=Hirundo rustica rustica TaxID=333673 RepID=A0A3M0KJT0_HIRRU|nr:hypothetical protein DUI87_10851 [Hirundo rustica rustica]
MNETVSKVQGRAATQRNLIKLEKWADRNLMKNNEVKSSVLPPGRDNHRHQYSLRANQLKSSLAEKDLGVLMEAMSQQCAESPLHVRLQGEDQRLPHE